jgi:hypothetical protein
MEVNKSSGLGDWSVSTTTYLQGHFGIQQLRRKMLTDEGLSSGSKAA